MILKTTIILIIIVWLYLLSVLKRAKTHAFYFLVGSIGLFIILDLLSKPYGIWLFSTIVTKGVSVVGYLTGLFSVHYASHLIEIMNHQHMNLLFIDYECSGIIETMAFGSLIAFYPVYTLKNRFLLMVAGTIWIFLANIIRLSFVAIVIYYFGSDAFYVAHSILGRIIFYILAIILYYQVFTRGQIIQKFGRGLQQEIR